MSFRKVYIEITNGCNLNCSFCIKNKRKIEFISIDNFKIILDKIKGYTKYLYLHVMGEPLLHCDINYLIDYAVSMGFKVNITTNGYLIERIKDNININKINVSLHSYNDSYSVSLDDYLDNIFDSIDMLMLNNTYIDLRLWVNNKYGDYMLEMINSKYRDCEFVNVSYFHEFIWPDLNNDYYEDVGTCFGTRTHIGILVNGDVVPCCLDSEGIIKLGNIYTDSLIDIINSDRYKSIKNGFCNNKKCEELCKHCNFLE